MSASFRRVELLRAPVTRACPAGKYRTVTKSGMFNQPRVIVCVAGYFWRGGSSLLAHRLMGGGGEGIRGVLITNFSSVSGSMVDSNRRS